MQLPAPGYPISDRAIADWFRQTHGREPSTEESGAIMLAMTARDTSPPSEAPPLDATGWKAVPPRNSIAAEG